jgi:hypothetical protein
MKCARGGRRSAHYPDAGAFAARGFDTCLARKPRRGHAGLRHNPPGHLGYCDVQTRFETILGADLSCSFASLTLEYLRPGPNVSRFAFCVSRSGIRVSSSAFRVSRSELSNGTTDGNRLMAKLEANIQPAIRIDVRSDLIIGIVARFSLLVCRFSFRCYKQLETPNAKRRTRNAERETTIPSLQTSSNCSAKMGAF